MDLQALKPGPMFDAAERDLPELLGHMFMRI